MGEFLWDSEKEMYVFKDFFKISMRVVKQKA